MARAKAVPLTDELSAKLFEWQQANEQLAALKAREFALRQELVLKCGFDVAKLEGAETLEIANGNGYKIKATKKLGYTLTNDNQETQELLANIAKCERVDIAQSLVKWEPAMSIKAYRELVEVLGENPIIKASLAAALTVKPGVPTLEIIPPEAPKSS